MSAQAVLHPPSRLGPWRRRPTEWLVGLPTIALLLLVLVIGTGEMLHGQLLRMGEAMFGSQADGVQYFMLRADPEQPSCNPSLNIDAELDRQMQVAAASDDLRGCQLVESGKFFQRRWQSAALPAGIPFDPARTTHD